MVTTSLSTIAAPLQIAQEPYGELQPFLDAPTIEEIWINAPERIFIARNGKSELTTLVLTTGKVRAIMDRIFLWSGRRIDLSQPFVDARLSMRWARADCAG